VSLTRQSSALVCCFSCPLLFYQLPALVNDLTSSIQKIHYLGYVDRFFLCAYVLPGRTVSMMCIREDKDSRERDTKEWDPRFLKSTLDPFLSLYNLQKSVRWTMGARVISLKWGSDMLPLGWTYCASDNAFFLVRFCIPATLPAHPLPSMSPFIQVSFGGCFYIRTPNFRKISNTNAGTIRNHSYRRIFRTLSG